jgi:hypothetical protein
VAAALEDLHGPIHGEVALDRHLDWSPDPGYDLDDPGDLQLLYQTVLNEATTRDDLNRWLNADTLMRLWPILWVPARVRLLWQSRFPELAALSPRIAG